MRVKHLVLTIITLASITSSSLIGNAATSDSTTGGQNEINIIESQLNSIELEIEERKDNREHAHAMASAARKLEIDEEDEIIVTAKNIYAENTEIINELTTRKLELEQRKKELESERKFIGEFKLTGYCPCSICCGKWANGITASGKTAVEGITVAADPRVLPLGTKVYIEGIGERLVQDTGGAIKNKKIDVYVSSHSKAYNPQYNQSNAKVWIIE